MPFGSLSYTPGVPNPPNLPSVDVPDMQTNTNSIQTYLERDHMPFINANAGAHQQVNLNETNTGGTPTLPSLLAGVGFQTLYSTTNSVQIGGNSGELYFTRGGSGVQIQLTGPLSPTYNAPPGTLQTSNGYTFLAGGILIQFGFTNAMGNVNSQTFGFPQAFNTANPFITIVGDSVNNAFCVSNANATGFTVKTIGGAVSNAHFYWIAIGN